MLLTLNDGRSVGISQSPTGVVLELHEPGSGPRVAVLTPAQQVTLAALLICAHAGGIDVTGAMKATEAFAREWKAKAGR